MRARDRDGTGQFIDVSLLETQAGGADRRATDLLAYEYHGLAMERAELSVGLLPAGYCPAADGYVYFMVLNQWWPRLTQMLGRPDLLSIARMERGVLQSAPETVDLSALLSSLAETYAAPARHAGAHLEVSVEPGLSALVHREMLLRLLDNLVLNALDFVRTGGRVQLAAWAEGSELLRRCLGDHLFESFLQNKRIEWAGYSSHVSDYELKRYLPIL